MCGSGFSRERGWPQKAVHISDLFMYSLAVNAEDRNLIVVLGPTAAGKTRFAALLAHAIQGEIVSADSRQVYRQMDLGTGKDYADYIAICQFSKRQMTWFRRMERHGTTIHWIDALQDDDAKVKQAIQLMVVTQS